MNILGEEIKNSDFQNIQKNDQGRSEGEIFIGFGAFVGGFLRSEGGRRGQARVRVLETRFGGNKEERGEENSGAERGKGDEKLKIKIYKFKINKKEMFSNFANVQNVF